MLTRLRVRGFKNLADVDVSFGPFTCIAGVNGAGKSNLFDAITFLSALADRPLMDAARSVRDERNRSTDVRSLFLKVGDKHAEEMSFEAEMLIPAEGQDDLGQTAKAAITFLRYTLVLRYRREQGSPSGDRLEIAKEELEHIKVTDARAHLQFPHNMNWRKSVVMGRRTTRFLSTAQEEHKVQVKLHQEGRGGRSRRHWASQLPRTVLSSTNALESPTALLARREMQSWRLLQLEPSSLRNADKFHDPPHIGVDGSHLASTLYHLARRKGGDGNPRGGEEATYAQVANRLADLVDDVYDVRVDEDRQRELLTVQVVDRDRHVHAARALSDGTLRFLALAILAMDPGAQGLLCFEEPENGIHPERISSMLKLLKDLCVDTEETVDADNPLRQVIVNTHSPAVVGLVDGADLLVAQPRRMTIDGQPCRAVAFSWLSDTWRHHAFPEVRTVSRGDLRAYLNPLALAEPEEEHVGNKGRRSGPKRSRVRDRDDLRPLLPFTTSEE